MYHIQANHQFDKQFYIRVRGTQMNDVFILGAGFSKAIHSGMPILEDLTNKVAKQLRGSKCSLPKPFRDLDNNIEMWITYLSQRQPWLTEYENDFNKSLAGRIRYLIEEVIEEKTAQASQTEEPPWLNCLIGSWHREQATVITLNYDTLVERASKKVQVTEKVKGITATQMYPPYFSDVQARSGVALWGGASLNTFSFLKLHGSINWYYSGRDDFFGETILFSGDLHSRRPQSRDKERLIIPPVTEKNTYFNNETVRRLWREAGQALQEAERVFIVGYSLPPSDLGMNFFLTNHRPSQETPIFLVNTDPDVILRYQKLMKWDVRDEFVDKQEPIKRFADIYPNVRSSAPP